MDKIYYAIYKISNKIDGKIYIGSHKTKNLNDSYMGSGKYLKRAQEKYGIENFTKEILFVFDTPEEMYAKESEIVNEEFLTEVNTYNLKIGGFGGFDYINSTGKNLYGKNGENGLKNLYHGWYREHTQEEFDKISKTLKEGYASGRLSNPFFGRNHSDETRRIIGEKNSINQSGKKNSQYGTRWIHSLELKQSKRIKKDDLLPEGWNEGRKMKF